MDNDPNNDPSQYDDFILGSQCDENIPDFADELEYDDENDQPVFLPTAQMWAELMEGRDS